MKIYINNESVVYTPSEKETWGILLESLLNDHIEKNHGITRILLNGDDTPEFFKQNAGLPIGEDAKTLEIFTKNSLEICQSGFQKAAAVVKGISAELIPCANLFRQNNITEGATKFKELMGALHSIIDFLAHVGVNFAIDYQTIDFNNQHTLASKIEDFVKTMQELVDAQVKQDYVEIADYLEYQLTEDMKSWELILDKLIDEINIISSTH